MSEADDVLEWTVGTVGAVSDMLGLPPQSQYRAEIFQEVIKQLRDAGHDEIADMLDPGWPKH